MRVNLACKKCFINSNPSSLREKKSLRRKRWRYRHGQAVHSRKHSAAATTIGFVFAAPLNSAELTYQFSLFGTQVREESLGCIFRPCHSAAWRFNDEVIVKETRCILVLI